MAKKRNNRDDSFETLSQIGKGTQRKEKKEVDFSSFDDFFSEEDVKEYEDYTKEAESMGQEFVDIDKLIPSKLNKWSMKEDESFIAIAESIKKNGFESSFAVIGEKNEDGTVTILSGHRRTVIAKKIGLNRLPVTYKEFAGDRERLEFITEANLSRPDSIASIMNNYNLFEEMYEAGEWAGEVTGRFSDFVAEKLGISANKMKNILFLKGYKENFWDLLDERIMTVDSIKQLDILNSAGKLKNFDEVIKELLSDKTVNDKSKSDKERKDKAKEILSKATKVRAKKSAPKFSTETNKLKTAIEKLASGKYEMPKKDSEKEDVKKSIDEAIKTLTKIKESI